MTCETWKYGCWKDILTKTLEQWTNLGPDLIPMGYNVLRSLNALILTEIYYGIVSPFIYVMQDIIVYLYSFSNI